MALRGKEELQFQQLLNNWGYNLLQFSNRMTELIVAGSPELSLIARTQLMTSLGLLSMKTMELCQAWDQFEYAYKSTGIPWPQDFDVAFPKKQAEEEEDSKKGRRKEPKKTKRKHPGDTVVPPSPALDPLTDPLTEKKTFKQDPPQLSQKKQDDLSHACVSVRGDPLGHRRGGTGPLG